jgi:hypothetical protein
MRIDLTLFQHFGRDSKSIRKVCLRKKLRTNPFTGEVRKYGQKRSHFRSILRQVKIL